MVCIQLKYLKKTKNNRDDNKFNKLSISNGIGIFINNELKNWNNCYDYMNVNLIYHFLIN